MVQKISQNVRLAVASISPDQKRLLSFLTKEERAQFFYLLVGKKKAGRRPDVYKNMALEGAQRLEKKLRRERPEMKSGDIKERVAKEMGMTTPEALQARLRRIGKRASST